MGTGVVMKCPKCGFRVTCTSGVSMSFPTVYMNTVSDAKEGKFGIELEDFFAEHPEGAINAENVTLCCDNCGSIRSEQDLSVYLPKDENKRSDTPYLMAEDLSKGYELYAAYDHRCKDCGGHMHVIETYEGLLCPKCKSALEWDRSILWD